MENPREGIKNHDLSKNKTFLLDLACIMYGEKDQFTMRLHFSPTNSLLSSQNIWLVSWVLALEVQLHVPFIL